SEAPYKISCQGIAKGVLHPGGDCGGVDSIYGQRTGRGKDKNRVADIVSDGSGHTGCHGESCAVDGGRIHRLAESGSDDRKGTHPGRTIGGGDRNYGWRAQACGLRIAVWIAASGEENEHEGCYEPALMRAFFI